VLPSSLLSLLSLLHFTICNIIESISALLCSAITIVFGKAAYGRAGYYVHAEYSQKKGNGNDYIHLLHYIIYIVCIHKSNLKQAK
jgi:hypothetical protein